MFDPHVVQNDFPILSTKLSCGKPLVYLDSAATSQKPQAVLDAITAFYTHDNANVHRGIHELGDRATRAWHAARNEVCDFFGSHPEELVVTRNATESANMLAYAWGDTNVHAGDLILATQLDHHSNLVPWQALAKRRGAEFGLVPVKSDGTLDLEWLDSKLKANSSKLKLLAFPHVSNTLGTVTPVATIEKMVRRTGAGTLLVMDAAQSAPHMPVDFFNLKIDAMFVSAHKMLGPMGVGGLFVRHELLSTIEPWLYGGGMIGEVYDDHTSFSENVEDRFTAGTPDVAGMVGWAAACKYLDALGMKNVAEHDTQLVEYALNRLGEVAEVEVVGSVVASSKQHVARSTHQTMLHDTYPLLPYRCGSVAFLYKNVHAHDVAQILSSQGVAVRSGHHCTMPLHNHMGWAATVRASFNVYTTKEDIDALVKSLGKVKSVFS